MKKGSVNEYSMQKALREPPFVKQTYDTGVMVDSERSGFACSSNCIDFLDMTKLTTPSDWEKNKSEMDDYGNKYAITTLEIKRDSLIQA